MGPHPEKVNFPESDSFGIQYLKSLPKAELHLHLEGSVTPSGLRNLSKRYGTEYSGFSEEELRQQLFQYEDFYSFLETYRIV
ncbi:MAG: hypothetical protein IH794_04385, partial [Acidobacteria bacterium]|nr:hypothetical protein [Acidobacteriota bacterium]